MTEATHIAAIQREIMARPMPLRYEPYEVSAEAYEVARDEMENLLRDRGWPVRSADIGRKNFLLMGIPVCAHGE